MQYPRGIRAMRVLPALELGVAEVALLHLRQLRERNDVAPPRRGIDAGWSSSQQTGKTINGIVGSIILIIIVFLYQMCSPS